MDVDFNNLSIKGNMKKKESKNGNYRGKCWKRISIRKIKIKNHWSET